MDFMNQLGAYRRQQPERTQKILHWIGIPAIFISVLILLSWVSISFALRLHITFAWLVVILLLIYYYFLDVRLAAVMTVLLILLNLLCSWIAFPAPTGFSLTVFLVLLIGGCIAEYIAYVSQKPTLELPTAILQMLIAPMFLLAELIQALGFGRYFKLEEPPSTHNRPPNAKN
ncbi:MAG: hypothetical protein A3F41_07120 [Coxiella sp. RIFCSPHIGHO2_12_FULL_44_14]|nr:MAG: hypothetical protein A3F41_07120 [Coxiella sp. RIFCSPHIGHO2_12_FULL_44_14]